MAMRLLRRSAGCLGGFYEPSPGAVYPTLQWLEDEGLVRSEVVEGRRVYSLTEAGERIFG
jgi:DNA-binding PadR family transcriptional regulator